MNSRPLRRHALSGKTRHAAIDCIKLLDAIDLKHDVHWDSPTGAIAAFADCLGNDALARHQITIVKPDSAREFELQSAWSIWLQSRYRTFEKPLLYMFGKSTLDGLHMVSLETAQRGIFCNDAETRESIWSKGVNPAVSLWLASEPFCTPFDPASADEARAILRAALRSLYINHEPGFYYLATHDDCRVQTGRLSDADARYAARGMYRLKCTSVKSAKQVCEPKPKVRLCGAGKALRDVLEAASLLADDWGVTTEVWSCPSYTRLAREARAAARWNLLHPQDRRRQAHVERCLNASTAPVIAVTGYTQPIAEQIAPFISARFVALGANPRSRRGETDSFGAQWIVAKALKALVEDKVLPVQTLEAALRAYALR